jgi:hypothetical protein
MKAWWNALRPLEKRLVVGVGVLFFIVLNFLFVIPHLSDVDTMYSRLDTAKRTLRKYQAEFAQTNNYATALRRFEREGLDVAPEEQSYQFANAIQAQAGKSGVKFLSNGKIITQTNQFFLEKSQSISVQATEEHLVDFLYDLGSGESLIRVRDLGLGTDPAHQELVARVKLVASYQKKSTAKPGTPSLSPTTTRPSPPPRKVAVADGKDETIVAKPAPKTLTQP